MDRPDTILALEQASLDGLPALHTERYDGWLIRQSNGYARRANSVWPLYPSTLALEEKILHCEASYARAGLPCTFRLTQSSELDELLAARGYQRDAETVVQVLELPTALPRPDIVELASKPDGAWMTTWQTLSDRAPLAGIVEALLQAIPTPRVYATIQHDGEGVACGRAAMSGDWVGLFDLLVAPNWRRRGFGKELTRARLSWGIQQGARRAFAQVMDQNAAARQLQASLEFVEAYRYWYRSVKTPRER